MLSVIPQNTFSGKPEKDLPRETSSPEWIPNSGLIYDWFLITCCSFTDGEATERKSPWLCADPLGLTRAVTPVCLFSFTVCSLHWSMPTVIHAGLQLAGGGYWIIRDQCECSWEWGAHSYATALMEPVTWEESRTEKLLWWMQSSSLIIRVTGACVP